MFHGQLLYSIDNRRENPCRYDKCSIEIFKGIKHVAFAQYSKGRQYEYFARYHPTCLKLALQEAKWICEHVEKQGLESYMEYSKEKYQ